MKIACTLYRYFPHGGAQRDCLDIAEGLAAHGHAVAILTRAWQGPRPAGVAVVELPVDGWTNQARNRRFAAAAAARIARDGFDFVLGFDRMPGLDAYFAADRCLAERLAQRSPLARLMPRARAGLAMERAVYGADAKARILLLVEAERAAIQRHYATPGARFAVLPPILPQAPQPRPWSAEQRQAKRAALGFTAETLALLFVASRFRTKGLDRALAAVDRLPRALRERALLLVVGGDRARPYRYRRGVDRAVFLGARDDLGELMRAADLLLHPAREEMAGKVLVEAMQQGLPVLCSGVAGYAPLVARAAAGVVLPEPFRQPALDRALATLLAGLPDAALKENGPAFVRETPEFGRGIAVAVATVDRWARQGGGR